MQRAAVTNSGFLFAPLWLILQMNRLFLTTTVIALFVGACGEKKEPPSQEQSAGTVNNDSAKTGSPYFPVYDFIRNEIEYVDSLPVGIKQYTITGKKQDSGYIQLEEFHTLAGEFLVPEIYDSAFRKLFKESSFFDRSNNTSTFFYKTDDESSPVKRVDVVTRKGDVYDEVTSVYIEKVMQSGDSTFIKKMFWKPKRNFQVATDRSSANGKSATDQVKVVWDNRE